MSLGTTLSNVTYTWLLNGQVVAGDNTDSYTPAVTDQGKTLDVVVNFTDPNNASQTDQVTGVAGTVQPNTNYDDWNGTGNWTTNNDWSSGTPPGLSQVASLDSGAVTFSSSSGTVLLAGLTGTASATLDVTGGSLTVTNFTAQGPLGLSGGTLNIGSSNATIALFTQSGGTLSGSGTVTVTGLASLGTSSSYVVETGSGTTNLQGGGTIGNTTNNPLYLDGGRVLQNGNDGTLKWVSGTINMGDNPNGTVGGSTIVNSLGATFNDAVAGNIDNETGTNVFTNAGLFETTFTSGTTTIGVTFNNTGTVNVGSGDTLDLSDGGSSTGGTFTGSGTLQFGSGTYNLDANSPITTANVTFSAGTTNINGTYNVTGTTLVSGGTANLGSGTLTSLGSALNISGGALNVGSNGATVASLTQSGGTLSGSGTVTVTGLASLGTSSSYVVETGSGTTNLQGGGTIGNTTNNPLYLDGGRVLQNGNDGTLKWVSGTINMGYNPNGTVGSSTIVNSLGATFNDAVAGNIDNETGTNVFTNAGLFETTFTSGTTTIGVTFNNTGTVNVGSGDTLDLSDGGSSTGGTFTGSGTLQFGSGTYNLDANSPITTANVTFSAGTTNINGTYNVTGTTLVSGGTANLGSGTLTSLGSALNISGGALNVGSNGATVASLTQSGGTLSGSGTVTVTGLASLGTSSSYVVETGSGTTNLQGGGTIGNTTNNPLYLDGGRVLQNGNDGTLKWVSGTINMGDNPNGTVGSSTIVNSLGATFNDAVAGNIDNETGTNVFTNAGLFETTFTSGTTTIGVTFNNTGTVNVGSGDTLDLSDGGSSTGGTFTGSGTLQFGSGTYNLDANSPITTANVTFSAGTTNINGTYNVTGTTLVSGGTANLGSGTLTSLGSALNISGGALNVGSNGATVASLTQSGGTLSGSGTVTVTGLASLGTSSSYVVETGSGTTNLQGGGTIGNTTSSPGFYLDGGRVLQNENDGTLKWVSGTIFMGENPNGTLGGSTIVNSLGATFNDAVAGNIDNETGTNVFTNAGMFETTFASGIATIGVTFNNTGTVNVGSGDTLDLSDGGSSTGGTFTGSGTLQLGSGYTFDSNSTVSTTNVLFSAGTTTLAGTYDATNTTLSGGTLATGANPITLAGNFTQSGGTLSGTGIVTVTGSASLGTSSSYVVEAGSGTTNLQGGGTIGNTTSSPGFYLDGGRVLQNENDGTLKWVSGTIFMGENPNGTLGGSTIVNSLGATFNDAVAGNIDNETGTNVFTNAGMFETTFASGIATIGVTFNNTGTVNVGSGDTLDLSDGGSSTGGTFTGSGTLQFGSGTYNLDANSPITTANVTFSAGTTNINGTYNVTGTTLVSGGTANLGSGTLTSLGSALNISGGALNVGSNGATVASLTQSGGTLSGSGTVTVTGLASLGTSSSYVVETGSGTTNLQGGGTIGNTTSSPGFYLDGGRVLQNENDGTLKWVSGTIFMGENPNGTLGGSTIVNSLGATFNDAVAGNIDNETGTNVFTNAGMFETTFASGIATIGVTFNNTGTVNVGSGDTLDLSDGGSSTGGTFTGSGTLQLGSGYTFDSNSTVSTTNVLFSAGTTTLAGTYDATNTTLSGGTLATGANPITLAGNFTQSGGTLSGTGIVTVTGSASLGTSSSYVVEAGSGTTNLQGGGTIGNTTSSPGFYLDGGRVLQNENDGTLKWVSGTIFMGENPNGTLGGSTIVNSLGATFNDAVAGNIDNETGTNVFTNAGMFETTFASGIATIGVTFNNTGTVNVGSGDTLDLSDGGSSIGGTFTGSGTLQFGGGYTFDSNSTVSTTNVLFSAGTTTLAGTYDATNTTSSGGTLATGANPITLAGNFTQSGGTLSGTGIVTVTGSASLGTSSSYVVEAGSGTTNLQGGGTIGNTTSSPGFYLDGGRVLQNENDGTLEWVSGTIFMGENPNGTLGGSTIVNSLGATFNDAVAGTLTMRPAPMCSPMPVCLRLLSPVALRRSGSLSTIPAPPMSAAATRWI